MSLPEESTSRVIYVGIPRRRKIEKLAIKLSAISGTQITAAQLSQDIIDTYLEAYEAKMLLEIQVREE
ncbi:hypothetical protein [Rouxiella badensis]|jgi:hypothetical protein|uniref:hypothetical protein n=1 Tax=Rouxiella badensis TaxID=1646377 RepID=UPI000369CE86|nr:hypothetical protein [Rouxiella badensis]QOI57997.1 hypothetical protein H2866_22620 [Rouxiella badensis subsp. acadiensis]